MRTRQGALGSLDDAAPHVVAMASLGTRHIVGLSDFHGDMHGNDPVRRGSKTRRTTPKRPDVGIRQGGLLAPPWEESSMALSVGTTQTPRLPKTVCNFQKSGKRDSSSTENDPVYGKVYHIAAADDVQLHAEPLKNGDGHIAPAHQELGGPADVTGTSRSPSAHLPGPRLHAGDGS